MGTGEWIGLGLVVAIIAALTVVLISAIRATTVRWIDLPGRPGCKYAWKGRSGDVAHLLRALERAEDSVRKHVKVQPIIIDAAMASVAIVIFPEQKIPNPSYPRIVGAAETVWGICWGHEIWVGAELDALCHELCHSILLGCGIAVTDHSRFDDLGATAAINDFSAV
jgi:hypothetical protein